MWKNNTGNVYLESLQMWERGGRQVVQITAREVATEGVEIELSEKETIVSARLDISKEEFSGLEYTSAVSFLIFSS